MGGYFYFPFFGLSAFPSFFCNLDTPRNSAFLLLETLNFFHIKKRKGVRGAAPTEIYASFVQ